MDVGIIRIKSEGSPIKILIEDSEIITSELSFYFISSF